MQIIYILLAAATGAIITYLWQNQRIVSLTTQLDLIRRQADEAASRRSSEFEAQLQAVKSQLREETDKILLQHRDELGRDNTRQMDGIISPLKETISQMHLTMERTRDTGNKNAAALEEQIRQMMKSAINIGSEADKLAAALRGESKTQGNWGEVVLSRLLEKQGFTEGVEYDVQYTIRDEDGQPIKNEQTGRRMIPDVILHYPDGKHLVIDSKVSLTAFMDYQDAEDEAQRKQAVNRHTISVRRHVDELSRKDYSSYIGGEQSIDYVIMFIPNESALQLALAGDQRLWNEAFEKNVFITSEQNLVAALRMIQLAWVQARQTQNQEKVFGLAGKLVDRVSDFYARFVKVGESLDKVKADYLNCEKKLITGQQSLIKPAKELVQLGAKEDPRKQLPEIED